jgi:hypothetical protein
MMGFVLMLHSIIRWAVILVAVLLVVKFALGWLRGARFGSMDRGLAAGFTGLLDLQGLLGLIYLFWAGLAGEGFPPERVLHAFIMLAAIVIAHTAARFKAAPDALRYRNTLLTALASLVLIVIGITVLPQGWLD